MVNRFFGAFLAIFALLALPIAAHAQPVSTITSVSPNSGSTAGGDIVTINGTVFFGVTGVTFDGIAATSFTVAGDGQSISAVTPAHAAGAVDVRVTTMENGNPTLAGGYSYVVPAPAIKFISPQHGPATGGTQVVITGANFTGATAVNFGANTVAFTVDSATQITTTAPSGPEGDSVKVYVTGPGGSSNSESYVYDLLPPTITSVTPNTGPTAGGNSVVIRGTGFDGILFYYIVQIGGVNVTSFTLDSPTQMTVVVPPHAAGTVDVSVQNERSINGIPAVLANSYTYGDYSISPSSVASGTVGTPYSQQFTANGGSGTNSFVLSAGALPAGVTLSSSGLLSGTPTAGGTFEFTIRATDSTAPTAQTVTSSYTLTIAAPTITLTPATLPAANSSTAYSQTLTASGGTGPFSFAVSAGTLPTGLTLSAGGVLSGTPTTPGTYEFTVQATDSSTGTGPFTGSRSYIVTVTDVQAPLIVNMPANITLQVFAPATGAVANWTAPTVTDNLPGATITQIAGPAPGSTFPGGVTTITYRATDVAGNTAEASFTVTVNIIQVGSVTYKVETPAAGTFTFTSPQTALNTVINAGVGVTSSAALSVQPGTYGFAFAVPTGFGVTSAACTGSGSSANAAAKTGSVVVLAGQNVTCTITVVQSLLVTTEAIGDFMEIRANLITTNEPDLGRRLDRVNENGGAGGGNVAAFGMPVGRNLPFSASLMQDRASFSFSMNRAEASAGLRQASSNSFAAARAETASSLSAKQSMLAATQNPSAVGEASSGSAPASGNRFDIWVEGVLAEFDAGKGNGTFKVLHSGLDYLVSPGLLVGLGIQADWTDMDTRRSGTISGSGFMAGPYMTARLSDRLFFDARLAAGTSSNHVSPFGTYQDHFDANRSLISAALIGDMDGGANMTIRPEARLIWFREKSDAYVDSLGVPIPSIEVATGQFRFGPELRWQLQGDNGLAISPHVKFDGIWTFDRKNTARTVLGGLTEIFDKGLRGRVEGGVRLTTVSGISTSLSTFYDGIGGGDYSSWGGRVQLHIGF